MWSRIQATIHVRLIKFFRLRLLSSSPEDIKKLIDGYEQEVEAIKKNALSMAWYMRGGASYVDILNMSASERKAVNDLIESNLEVTKKSQMPFF